MNKINTRLIFLFQHVRIKLEKNRDAADYILWDPETKPSKEMVKWCQDQWRRKRSTLVNHAVHFFPGKWCQTLIDGTPTCHSCGATCPSCRVELQTRPQELEEAILNIEPEKKGQRRPVRKRQEERLTFTESVADRIKRRRNKK